MARPDWPKRSCAFGSLSAKSFSRSLLNIIALTIGVT